MERLAKEIHAAFYNVSQICDQFFKKYPQHYPPQTQLQQYSPYHYSGYPLPRMDSFPPSIADPWYGRYSGPAQQYPSNQAKNEPFSDLQIKKYKPNESKELKSFKQANDSSKKNIKQDKKYEKKIQLLRRQRQKQQLQRLKQKQQTLKNKKKEKHTLKNQIKKDIRYAQKPKFPMSPYFLFLRKMRQEPSIKSDSTTFSNKLFAQQMGKIWRNMTDDQKKPYVAEYLTCKKAYDTQIENFYNKYPDLRPRKSYKDQKPMYSVDDPKYQVQDLRNEPELENDLIGQLNSEQDKSEQQQPNEKSNMPNRSILTQTENSQEQQQEEVSKVPSEDSLLQTRIPQIKSNAINGSAHYMTNHNQYTFIRQKNIDDSGNDSQILRNKLKQGKQPQEDVGQAPEWGEGKESPNLDFPTSENNNIMNGFAHNVVEID